MPQRAPLAESRPLHVTEATTAGDGGEGRFLVQLITPGWGSSGYYSQAVLEAAGEAQVFPAGTHMYLNHPTAAEDRERPVRDVRDWAAVLEADATWDGAGLSAPVRVFPDFRQFVEGRADVLGVSIRGSAEMELGEAEGRRGYIVTEMVAGTSVDFVTRAGRGGRILEMVEHALPSQVTARAAGRGGVDEATANDIRERLRNLLQGAYGSDNPDAYVWVWLRDFDPDARLAWFEVEGGDAPGLFQQAYTADDAGVLTLGDGPVEVRVETRYVPVGPAGDSTTQESRRIHMPDIEEARLRQLEADAGRVPTLESELGTERQARETAERRVALSDARDVARPIAQAVLAESALLRRVPPAAARVTESVLAALPLTDAGALDEAAFRTAVETARTEAEVELAATLAAAGHGRPRGLGDTAEAADEFGGEPPAVAAARAKAFGRKPETVKGA